MSNVGYSGVPGRNPNGLGEVWGGSELKELELVILGAGPGGLAAATEASRAGASVTLLDENPKPGGQIYRQFHEGFHVTSPATLGHDYMRGQKLLDEFSSLRDRVALLDGALVWGLFNGNELAFHRGENSYSVRYGKLIIAAGAYDRPVPFPGWTLPGVFTAGGAQTLVKTQRVLPGEKFLLAGTGPLQLTLANQIADAGGRVEAIAEAGHVDNWFKLAASALGQWQLLSDAMRYLLGIRKARIPLWRNHIIVEARGDGQVEEAVVAQVDRDWRPKGGTRKTLKVDTICVGYGFVPSVELTRLAECEHRYEPRLGGWIPVRDHNMETSVPGVYAVGDCTGVAGSLVAIEEGRIAGISAARSLGHLSAGEARKSMEPSRRRLGGLARLRRVLDEVSAPRPGLFELANDDTIVCRCEEITLGQIKEALAEGALAEDATGMRELKRTTRMGMGPCQGRMCGPAIQEMIAREKNLPHGSIGHLNPRPPVKPVPLKALAEHQGMANCQPLP
jgi:thioredoxin reductase/bacterioferritin-associated ferredoxin